MKRLLITARDAAAALHLIEVAKVAQSRNDLMVLIVAQMPADRYFRKAGLATTLVTLPAAPRVDSPEAEALMAKARSILADFRPDSVLCGLSTPFDGGIDEAVLAHFKGPSYVMQDFWGEANTIFGRTADLYLALDDEGVRLSRERHGVAAEAVGSPRHSAYRAMDIPRERAAARGRLGVGDTTTVIGFFGQALHHLAGYRRTLRAWAEASRHHPGPCLPVYRPHPRESEQDREWTKETLKELGLDIRLCQERDVEHALLGCDVVCSAFSNCTYDVAYLNYFSEQPLITPVSLFFDEEIVSYFRRIVRLSEFPYLKAGLVEAVRSPGELASCLLAAGDIEFKRKYWTAARGLQNPTLAPQHVLERVLLF